MLSMKLQLQPDLNMEEVSQDVVVAFVAFLATESSKYTLLAGLSSSYNPNALNKTETPAHFLVSYLVKKIHKSNCPAVFQDRAKIREVSLLLPPPGGCE